MLQTTLDLIRASLRADPTITPEERTRLLARLRKAPDSEKADIPLSAPPRLLRRAEAAKRLSIATRTLDQWAQQGIIRKRILPGRRRSVGFLESDVMALITGTSDCALSPG